MFSVDFADLHARKLLHGDMQYKWKIFTWLDGDSLFQLYAALDYTLEDNKLPLVALAARRV